MRNTPWLLVLLVLGSSLAQADDPPKAKSKGRVVVEARFNDGSTIKLTLRDEVIELESPYGRLRVPTNEIRRVELATRIPPDVAARIDAWIADLGNPHFQTREAATTELTRLHDRAYHALLAASKQKDAEIAKRADELLERIRAEVPEEQLEFRPHDVIWTSHSKIAGRIDSASLRADTTQFGEVALKLSDVRSLRTGPLADVETANVVNDPGNLNAYQGRVGSIVAFRVTGNANGSIWGTDVYTFDSPLSTAAVHAGLVKVGQTGVVRVKIIPSPQTYQGSLRNGVQSNPYGAYSMAYEFIRRPADD